MPRLVVLLIGLCALAGTACHEERASARAHAERLVIEPEGTSFVEFDGVRVEVGDGLSFESTLDAEGSVHRVDDEVVDVVAGRLRIGGRDYGPVRPGQTVVVGSAGVRVDGVPVEPVAR